MNTDCKISCKKCNELETFLVSKDCEINRLVSEIQNLQMFLNGYETQARNCQFCCVIDELKASGFSNDQNTLFENNLNTLISKKSSKTSLKNIANKKLSKTSDLPKVNSHGAGEFCDTSNEECTNESENSSEYIYDDHFKMYYCPSIGYYYDQKSGLFYDPQTQEYYTYNYSKGEYELCSDKSTTDELLEEDCDSVLDKVNELNICDNDDKSANTSYEEKYCLEESLENNCIQDDKNLDGFTDDWKPEEGSNATVKDLVRNAAEQFSGFSDYVYDKKSEMYYNQYTGHCYDPAKKLLYDPHAKTYYLYVEETASYEFYCKAEEADTMSLIPKCDPKKKHKKKAKKEWRKKVFSSDKHDELSRESFEDENTQDSLEEGEIVSTDSASESDCSTENALGPPCIRAIVKKSSKLKTGSLILITCTGAIIGREKFNTICVPEIGVSKTHAEITFNNGLWKYVIEDLGSQNGSFVNNIRLSEPKQKSEPLALSHGDSLVLGSCELLLHIHEGHITCDKCEPGQVLAEISAQEVKLVSVIKSKEEKEKERKKELSRLKKKYGLKDAGYVSEKKSLLSGSKYEDKAEIRRQTVGSQNPYEKTESASMQVAIADSNKGFQMLKKLGWKEGGKLGVSGTGLSEPIPIHPWVGKAGLGCAVPKGVTIPLPTNDRKTQRWVKAQERYFQLK